MWNNLLHDIMTDPQTFASCMFVGVMATVYLVSLLRKDRER